MSCSEWKEYVLGNICGYRKEKISVDNVNVDNYVSTENMLQDKKGVTVASSIPNTKNVDSYIHNDVLISNIRPYFKKIWFADKNGGASSDVLIFYSLNKNILNKKYLYYLLSSDDFFDYVMSTSKGTKMPRGDKDAIMKYKVELPPLEEQEKIANILSSLDDKIELNNEMNKTLEGMAQSIFKRWFVDFEFPNEDGEPYKSSGGEMVESELGMIPRGWEVKEIGETELLIEDGDRGKNYPNKSQLLKEGYCPFLNNKNIINDKINFNDCDFISKERDELLRKGKININDIILTTRGTVGNVGILHEELDYKFARINSGMVIIKNNSYLNLMYLYSLMKSDYMKTQYKSMSTGTAQPQLPIKDIKKMKILIPEKHIQMECGNILKSLYNKIFQSEKEISILMKQREYILPKLMNGDIPIK